MNLTILKSAVMRRHANIVYVTHENRIRHGKKEKKESCLPGDAIPSTSRALCFEMMSPVSASRAGPANSPSIQICIINATQAGDIEEHL